jgi:Cysteine-rich secretory protein family
MKQVTWLFLAAILFLSFSPAHAQDVVSDLLGRINNLRTSLGLAPYTLNAALNAAAQNHAQWMARTGEVSHTQENGSRPVDRAQANGYVSSWVSENIYMGSIARVDDAWTFWMNSSIHYAGITNNVYQDVGIASATGDYGQSFVLVFGNPSGNIARSSSNNNAGSGGGNDVAASAPLPILGFDGVGNIRYQLQEGETLGDVLLIFGYTWDELPEVLALNNFTEADIRSLDVGQEILVPPHAGTWTPTAPAAEITSEATIAPEITAEVTLVAENSLQMETMALNSEVSVTVTATPNNAGILPTPSGSNSFILAASPTIETAVEQIAPPAVFGGASPTSINLSSSPSPSPTQTLRVNDGMLISTLPASTSVAMLGTDIPLNMASIAPVTADANGIPIWLIGAIVVQLGVLAYASFEFLRRMLKR